ncbi:MAG: PQQ-binding-like beta-propeller repeat protein [Gemmataceae bacterium]
MTRARFGLFTFAFLLFPSAASAGDWVHWRGPEQTGFARETGLPEYFGVDTPGKDNLIWKAPFGGRSAPLVLKGRVYTISGYDMSQPTEGERVMCFDEATGKVLWESRFNVFHTDIVSSRLGWTTLTADPEAEHVFTHTTGGFLFCFDKNGHILWKRQLTEEFGRVTGYGGRIVSPIFDDGLVIVGMVNGSWGDQARGHNRFVACDAKTGEVVWWSSPTEDLVAQTKATNVTLRGTYYSNPVIAVVNGQRLLVTGGADGCVHALKVRTGERVWSHHFSAGVVNPSPVVSGNLVYISHGEENPEGGPIGRVVCLDASQVTNKKPKLVWENKRLGKRFGLASPAIADGRLYLPEDSSKLNCFDAKTGKRLWEVTYGTVSRGAPLVADGKLYIFDVNARMVVYKLKGDEEPEELEAVPFRRESGIGFVETHGTPIAVNGRLYFLTQDFLYCVGKEGAAPGGGYKPLAPETTYDPTAVPAAIRVFPADVLATPGQTVKFTVEFLDANGRKLPKKDTATGEWSLPLPPKAPSGAQPPALVGEVKGDGDTGTLIVGKLPTQQGVVTVKYGKLTGRARVRVAAQTPYRQDFDKVPTGATPGGWVNVTGKYTIAEVGGSHVLSKVNTDARPPIARANGYITGPWAGNYTITADVMGTEVRGRFPDLGVVNSRYTLILDGKSDSANNKRQARVVSWEARPRINKAAEFDWQPGVWYRVKLTVEPGDKTATVRAKVWKRDDAEPAGWTVELDDPSPNREGAAAVYAYISDPSISDKNPGSNAYFDNVTITPNGKK